MMYLVLVETKSEFFFVTPIGFEQLCSEEILLKKIPHDSIHIEKGGLTVIANKSNVSIFHQYLKIPTRILLRLSSFKAKDLPTLHRKILKQNINDYFATPPYNIIVSSKKSRLIHTDKIRKSVLKTLKTYFIQNTPKTKHLELNPPDLYIRIVDDIVTLSVDCTGAPLYKRGNKEIRSKGAIRENYAAALITKLFKQIKNSHNILDPMCGGGTLLSECHDFFLPLKRNFAFEEWTCGHIHQNFECQNQFSHLEYFGRDIDETTIEKLHFNYIHFKKADLFNQNDDNSFEKKKTTIICNPPYNKRIKIKSIDLKKILPVFKNKYQPLAVGIIHPISFKHKYYKKIKTTPFNNNGIKVMLQEFKSLNKF